LIVVVGDAPLGFGVARLDQSELLLPILLPINLVLFSILIKTNGHHYFMALLGHCLVV
jgi:hypothetical protein